MGKRKTAKKPLARAKESLPTSFKCLSCLAAGSVQITLKKLEKMGTLACRACKITWKTKIGNLSHQVDVYARWVDAFMELQANPALATGGDAADGLADFRGGEGSDSERDDGEDI